MPEQPSARRPRDTDELYEAVHEILAGLNKANTGVEGVKRRTSALWGLVVASGLGIWWLASFVTTYNSVMANGSPAMLNMKGELTTQMAALKKTDDDRYDKLNEILLQLKANNDLMDKRLTRLESK